MVDVVDEGYRSRTARRSARGPDRVGGGSTDRRFDHMQQHTGHSAVGGLADLLGSHGPVCTSVPINATLDLGTEPSRPATSCGSNRANEIVWG